MFHPFLPRRVIGQLCLLVICAPLLWTYSCYAAKPKTEWTPREPEYIRVSKGAVISAGKDSGGFWMIVDPLLFFKADDLQKRRHVEYTFMSVVPEPLQSKTQLRVFQEKGDGEFGPRIATYSKKLGLKMLVKSEVVVKPPKSKRQIEASAFGGRD